MDFITNIIAVCNNSTGGIIYVKRGFENTLGATDAIIADEIEAVYQHGKFGEYFTVEATINSFFHILDNHNYSFICETTK